MVYELRGWKSQPIRIPNLRTPIREVSGEVLLGPSLTMFTVPRSDLNVQGI